MTAPGRGGPGSPALPNSIRGFALVGLAVIVGIIGLQILDDSGGTSSANAPSKPTTTTSTPPSSGPHENHGDVAIRVFNASDVQNAAQTLSDKLKSAGYNMLTPKTLNSTQKGTTVQCRPGFSGDATALAVFGVGNGAVAGSFPANPPAGSEDADCIIILGTQ